MKVKSFQELRIFKLAREINKIIWAVTRRPEVSQDKRIVQQMLGSSGSMMDNIAEGFGRGNNREFKTFLGYANASADELHSQLTRLRDRNVISGEEYVDVEELITSFGKQTSSLITSLKQSERRGFRME